MDMARQGNMAIGNINVKPDILDSLIIKPRNLNFFLDDQIFDFNLARLVFLNEIGIFDRFDN